jgi:hypothetical protein
VEPQPNNLIDTVPSSQAVRERLCQTLREAQLLRSLLKVAEQKERARQAAAGRRKGDGNAT